jgi:tetratricopeptide (TPR) repeat protein
MSGRITKIAIICLLIVGLGISFKPILKRFTFSCSAENAGKEMPDTAASSQTQATSAPAAPPAVAPAEPAPQGETPSAPEETRAPPAGKYDFSDSSHWNLTVSAWESLAQKDFEGVSAYANKCLELYEAKAKEMAAGMRSFSRSGHEDDFALVNDVATSHYIMGEAYMKLGRTEDALKEFNYIIAAYPYAQCWDPKGWFWKVAEVGQKNIDKIGKPQPQEAPGGPQ